MKTAKNGEIVEGSKKALISAIRNGADIKIGWGSKGKNHIIEHLATPIWLAILDENEVLAHLSPQVLSNVDWEHLEANYEKKEMIRWEWRVVITSKGSFDAIWYDRKYDTLIKRIPQQHAMTWFIKSIATSANKNLYQ
ncbi:hypothetical protein [Flagellimonas meishanensis]|uniref:hypothetical protein n=1 Tax=Flagellimonas meishanensis TaxID=2873264 RepID=UPI001CA6D06C|nr:hypothetical protein [[Muricauda] meishanensis]